MSKRGLSARHYASNQTLIMVNTRLPKGILAAGNAGGRMAEFFRNRSVLAAESKTARLRVQTGGYDAGGRYGGTSPAASTRLSQA
jgi:hypothetical protein